MTKPIRCEALIKASSKKIYDTLTDGKLFSAMSGGAPAEMTKTEGAPFSCFGGMIAGRTIELAANERIVQAWRVKLWPAGAYSLAKFDLTPQGNDTLVTIEHTAYPEDQAEHLSAGWHTSYLEPLKKLFP